MRYISAIYLSYLLQNLAFKWSCNNLLMTYANIENLLNDSYTIIYFSIINIICAFFSVVQNRKQLKQTKEGGDSR